MMQRSNDFVYVTEYIKNILYFATVRHDRQITSTLETHYFSIDNELVYENYYSDFGPLNLGCVYKYCKLLSEKLKLYLNKQAIVHYASADPRKAANAAFLMGCYGVLHLGLCPKDALKSLTKNGSVNFRPFQDATEGDSIFTITVLDCLKAIRKARDLGFFNFKDFNFEEYERLDKIAGGDLNWIVPGKFLAFIGPVDYSVSLYHPPEIYVDYFLENDVKIVIRLNKRLYDGDVFKKVGIAHCDLFFADGSCPPRHVLFKFLQMSENANCAIAVHCKAGLGRTGSLIGTYLIKHYMMTAREAIAWMRICRPGSVIGHQQGWLEQLEPWLTKQGNAFRQKYFNDEDRIPVHAYGVYSIAEKTMKRKPNSKLFEKANQSPPPPIEWNNRSDILAAPRPRASKFREAAISKMQKGLESGRTAGSSKDSIQRTFNKGDQVERGRSTARRGSYVGSGERPSNPPSHISSRTIDSARTNASPKGRSTARPIVNNNTAVAQIAGQNNKSLTCRILLDSGSMRSYITSRLAENLEILADKEDNLIVYTFGSTKPDMIKSPSAEVTILTKRQVEKKIRVNIVPYITDNVPIVKINHPEVDIIADDESLGQKVDMLIGNDLYFSFIKNNRLKIGEYLYMVDSIFGWLFSGGVDRASYNKEDALSVVTYCNCHDANCPYFTEADLPLRNIDMKFLWTLESIGITDSAKTTKEEEAVHHFNATVDYSEGRYQVKWPWIQYPPELPTNYGLALGRLKSLLRRSDEETLQSYNEILKEQLEANIIEVVQPPSLHDTTHPIHFLPHHFVKQKDKRGRIVYDASARIKNEKSLNECLYRGPSMLEDLTGLILNFRMGKIGLTADVEKAFLQVGLQMEDRDVTRFLWVKDPSKEMTEDNIVQYRFCRVPFGIICSPFLLTATIRFHISKTEKSLLPKIAEKCYVDNLVTSGDSIEEALQLYKNTNRIFQELGMNIRDWVSNEKKFTDDIPLPQRAKQTDKIKILGLLWNLESDSLQLNIDPDVINIESKGITKRGVLKVLARLYDPCGFAAPLILPGKLLFQELCTRKLKWEDILPDDMQASWENMLRNLTDISNIKVPRYAGNMSITHGEMVQYELHGYTDASMNSFAAVVYLRVIGSRKTSVTLLMSKSRITPMEDKNDLKIPRLELLAFLIGSRLMRYICDHIEINLSKRILWSDSKVVLAWMKTNKLLPPFVARRVNEIKQTSQKLGLDFCYVNTKDNPADIATRPELWLKKQELWFHGPEYLTQEREHWPKYTQSDEQLCLVGRAQDMIVGPEMSFKEYEREEAPLMTDEQEHTMPLNTMPLNEESSDSNETMGNDITTDRIKRVQREFFPNEVLGKKTSLSLNLGIFQDVDGLLRSKGRLGKADWSYDKKYPILIPKQSPLSTQIIRRTHEENYHVGVPHTLSILREKYWIPQGRAQVQKVIRNCPQCLKHGGGPFRLPPPPALPSSRVNYSRPFYFTGLDYLGPVLVATAIGKEKRWICLLTCLAVRALHLELVKDLSAKECLLAIRRFTAIRGIPQTIVSDNALQFKLTGEVLTSDYCVNKGIKWKFITQLAPWQGGFYERLVALVKNCLKRTLDKHLLTESQMVTVLKEVEAVLNTRPLTAVGAEPDEVLKPADFLTLGQCLDFNPDSQVSNQQQTGTKVDLLQSWKRGKMILDEYKRMFINQYLPSLRERSFHTHKQPRVKSGKIPEIGNIVQIQDDSKNRTNWRVGRIVSLIKGQDGVVRVAKVRVNNTEFTRSIGHLYPLEVDNVEETNLPESQDSKEDEIREDDFISSKDMKEGTTPDINVLDMPLEQTMDPTTDDPIPTELSTTEGDRTPPLHENYPSSTELDEEPVVQSTDTAEKRDAAIKAREKIAEWTRHLLTVL